MAAITKTLPATKEGEREKLENSEKKMRKMAMTAGLELLPRLGCGLIAKIDLSAKFAIQLSARSCKVKAMPMRMLNGKWNGKKCE